MLHQTIRNNNIHSIGNTDYLSVFRSTIIESDIKTEDMEGDYIKTKYGGNRILCHAISINGEHILFVKTNSNTGTLLEDDPENNQDWIMAMGDNPAERDTLMEQGIERWNEAINYFLDYYKSNDAAIESLHFYEDRITEVEEAYLDEQDDKILED